MKIIVKKIQFDELDFFVKNHLMNHQLNSPGPFNFTGAGKRSGISTTATRKENGQLIEEIEFIELDLFDDYFHLQKNPKQIIMKRKLPQWLLDCTTNEIKNKYQLQSTANENSMNNIEIDSRSENTIRIVPLSNLLSPSRGGLNDQINVQFRGNHQTMEIESNDENKIRHSALAVKKETKEDPDETRSSALLVQTQMKEEPVATITVKKELSDTGSATVQPPLTTNVTDNQPIKIKTEATSTRPLRNSCNFGAKCFRRNPAHRSEYAHVGDPDYRRPAFPDAPSGAPPCPWGTSCYRRNPQHFLQLSHPPASLYNPTVNTTPNVIASRTNITPRTNSTPRTSTIQRTTVDIDSDDDDFEDPFIDDGSSDEYIPEQEDILEDDLSDTGLDND